jgi:hypothetical protein
LIQHSFSLDDQIDFAKLSGDYNPVHIDSVKARRTCFGHPVVHGLHVLLWALEVLVASKPDILRLVSLRTYFNQSIGLGEIVQFILKSEDETSAEIQLLSGSEQVARIVVSYLPRENEEELSFPNSNPASGECLDRNPEQLANATGSLDLCLSQKETTHRFPNLMRVFPSSQLAELMALTRLVGMECPGLHSIFSDLNLDFSNPYDEVPCLSYKVVFYDSRIGLLTQNVQAPGMTGTLRAFIRASPQKQKGYLKLSKLVKKGEFSGQTALIIGGSRGLGEVTGKLLAAGGARVVISYKLGAEEADNIVKEIVQGGGDAICIAFDTLCPNSLREEDFEGGWIPTHLYYFATPLIFQGQKNSFCASLFQEFCDYYVSGFFKTFQVAQSLGDGLQGVFYPSTVAIDELPSDMAEYASAKSAGETLCGLLRKRYTNMKICSPRLPRTATDQTNSLLPTSGKIDPTLLMLENLRQFRDQGKV